MSHIFGDWIGEATVQVYRSDRLGWGCKICYTTTRETVQFKPNQRPIPICADCRGAPHPPPTTAPLVPAL